MTFHVIECCSCGVQFGMNDELYKSKKQTRGPKNPFYCPNGRQQWFVGESDEEKFRRERDIAKQQLARAEQEAADARRSAELLLKQKRRLEKRAAAGTCPCCKRSFSNTSTHMRKQHPEFVAENVVSLKG